MAGRNSLWHGAIGGLKMTKAARALERRLATSTGSQVLIITAALMLMASIGLGSALAGKA
jgi:hypothetical protein